jgi:hypothetical protein
VIDGFEAVRAHGGGGEWTDLDAELADVELGLVAEHCEDDAGETVRNSYDRLLVATLGTLRGEIGMERMGRSAGMVSCLTEHRPQFG